MGGTGLAHLPSLLGLIRIHKIINISIAVKCVILELFVLGRLDLLRWLSPCLAIVDDGPDVKFWEGVASSWVEILMIIFLEGFASYWVGILMIFYDRVLAEVQRHTSRATVPDVPTRWSWEVGRGLLKSQPHVVDERASKWRSVIWENSTWALSCSQRGLAKEGSPCV